MRMTPLKFRPVGRVGFAALVILLGWGTRAAATQTHCQVVAGNTQSLQNCINTADTLGGTREDTVIVDVPAGTYSGQQIRINRLQNLWITGDTAAIESAQPRILYQDRQHVYTDRDSATRADTSKNGTYGQNNGTIWIYHSDNIRLTALLVDGDSATAAGSSASKINTSGRIFAYPAKLGNQYTVEIRGNVGVNILESRNVRLRGLSVTNAWNGISIIAPNFGGAFAFPDPNDPIQEVVKTLPTSHAGLYGNHLIERCRIHDNVFGILFQRDWDLSSVVRNNLFWNNYLRHWGQNGAKTCPPAGTAEYISGLCQIDTGLHADGSRRSIAFTTVGGAFLMTDVALTPYRIHNNTFSNNATIFSGYYKTGTQHLFYNNIIGKPFQFFRKAVDLYVQGGDMVNVDWSTNYTQTERQSEMLQYLGEHQRSNRVYVQDNLPTSLAVRPDYWSSSGGNLRLYNMRMIRTSTGNWPGGRSWSNDDGNRDSLGMTWVPDTTAPGTIGQISDTGGIVNWVRQNMWVGSAKDPMDPNPRDTKNGSRWCPPWIPVRIRAALGDSSIFRNTSAFDIRWTYRLPILETGSILAPNWLRRPDTSTSQMSLRGWPTYEGTATAGEAVKTPLSIGAYDATDVTKWAIPTRRLVLRDTLIESVTDSMVKFSLNVSGEGLTSADIDSLQISSAKFYNDVPVSDTLYNQGPVTPGSNLTTTRVNSVLSSKPWPLPYQFLKSDYDRAGFSVDDTLSKKLLSPENVFLARIGRGKRLDTNGLYARAEVVLKAKLKDGTYIYSNPGVFMFSRPRFQFTVTVTDTFGNPLPYDQDGMAQDVIAGQPIRVVVKAKVLAVLPVPFNGYANLQIGKLGSLVGIDGDQFQRLLASLWKPTHANDTISPFFRKEDSIVGIYHAMQSPASGTLSYQANFVDGNSNLLPYYIQGRSNPLKVISGSIYQVTIDSVRRDSIALVKPDWTIKQNLNKQTGAPRDTILNDGTRASTNISTAVRGDTLYVHLQVRDRYGNPIVGKDSTSAKKKLYIKLAHNLTTRYAGTTTDPNLLQIDTVAQWLDSAQFAFDSVGQAVAKVLVSSSATQSVLAALRASIVDSNGLEFGRAGSARDSGVVDTTWVRIQPADNGIQWVDSSGKVALAPINGWVGSWYPVRVKLLKESAGSLYTGSVSIATGSPVRFHRALGDTATVTTAIFAADSISQVLWVRADDSTTKGWVVASSSGVVDSVGNLRFRYPTVNSATFYDQDCDGRIDSMVVQFAGPLSFRKPTGAISGDSLDVIFPNQFLSPSALGAPLRVLVQDSVLRLAWNPAQMTGADTRANRVVLENPLVGKSISFGITTLVDRAIPVLVAATDVQSWGTTGRKDSVTLRFSEPIDASAFLLGSPVPFNVWRAGTLISLTATRLAANAVQIDSSAYSFVFVGATTALLGTDSIQMVAGSVNDLAGNSNATGCNPPVKLEIVPAFTPLPGWVWDINGDGNADSVHIAFKDSIGVLPEQILIRWGTPAETMTVTQSQLVAMGVHSTDTAFTVATRDWVGKTVVIDGDTIPNAPRTVGPMDSAWFNTGLVRAWLRDRVPPVVIHARLHYGPSPKVGSVGFDTLNVDFSESVQGCAVGSDPGTCLSQKGAVSDSTFPRGSAILSSSGSRWVLLVPQGTITVGISKIRGTPFQNGGVLTDVLNNLTGPGANWVTVLGDPPPPNHGWMLDRNGDGKVDAVLLHFLLPPPPQRLPVYTFEWGNASGSPTTLTASLTTRYTDATHTDSTWWMATLDAPGDYAATSYPAASQRMVGLQNSNTPYRFWVSDSVGPVLKPPATLKPSRDTAGYDTVIVIPSETMRAPTGSVLVEFKRGSQTVGADAVAFFSATVQADGSWKVILAPNGGYRPNPGDSVRLSTSGSARDTVGPGNIPDQRHPWVVLTGSLRMPYAAYYLDNSKDGRIDAVTLYFAVPPVVGSVIRVADPAGSDSTRTFVVAASDSGSKTITYSFANAPWGANVTSWVNTNLGRMNAPAGTDTAIVHGGVFPILDRVEPVIVSATLQYTSDTSTFDTLKVVFSENVKFDPSSIHLQSKHAGNNGQSGANLVPVYFAYDSTTRTATIIMKPFPVRDTNPEVGDSLRITANVYDASGNRPQTIAKWTEVKGNRRVIIPKPNLTNGILTPGAQQSGDIVGPADLPLVIRSSEPTKTGEWLIYDPITGTWKSTGTAYTPGTPGFNENGHQGTVFFVQTNVPVKLTLYIYDLVGTYVTSQVKDITQEMLDKMQEVIKASGGVISKVGAVDVGIPWLGQDTEGKLVGTGIYPVRLIAYRDPTPEELAAGKVNSLMYNRLMKVGVNLKPH